MKKPKISVILPVYNVEQTLEECLTSVVSQTDTLKELEIICVNDGSSDNSPQILQKYAEKYNFIKVFTQKNSGAGMARNKALNFANGKFVAFIDADDLYPSNDILRKLYNSAIENNVKICGGCFAHIESDGTIRKSFDFPLDGYVFKESKIIDYYDYQFDYGYHRFIYDLQMLRKNNIKFPDYRRFQDPPFFVRAMIVAIKFYAVDEIVYLYRIRNNFISWNIENVSGLMHGLVDLFEIAREYNLHKLHFYVQQRFKEHLSVINEQAKINNIIDELVKKSYDYINYKSNIKKDAIEKRKDMNMKNSSVNIAFVTDDNYVIPTAVAITSLTDYIDISTQYNIFIITTGLSPENEELLRFFNRQYYNISIKFIKGNKSAEELRRIHRGYDKNYSESGIYLSATSTALLKFELPELLIQIDKVLYLDSDILIQDNLIDLFGTNLFDNYVAAVRDLPQVLFEKQEIGGDIAGRNYFNSGIMLLNLKKMREDDITKKLIRTKMNLQDKSLMDQNVFNMVFKDAVLQLSFLYNFCYTNMVRSIKTNKYNMGQINQYYKTHYRDFNELISDMKIIHFSSQTKPWHLFDLPYADKWAYYYFKSPAADIHLQRIDSTQYDEREIMKIKERVKIITEPVKFDGNIIPIVFCTNNDYAPMCAAAIQSVMDNASANNYYDIYIFYDEELWLSSRERFRLMANQKNFNITLFNVEKAITQSVLYSRAHYSKQMYYRWLIPEVLTKYNKVLYLDCDIIAIKDVAELFSNELEDYIIGGINNFCHRNMESYLMNHLRVSNEEYINSGILLIDTRKFLLQNIKENLMNVLMKKDGLWCPDQDVLNIVCNGKIKYLDDKWNFQWHHLWSEDYEHGLIEPFKSRFKNSIDNFSIIHYTSGVKPWKEPGRNYAYLFWIASKKTLFYEELLMNTMLFRAEKRSNEILQKSNINLSGNDTEQKLQKISSDFEQYKQYQEEMEGRIISAMNEANFYRSELDGTRKSIPFKIGRFLTIVPRALKKLFKKK